MTWFDLQINGYAGVDFNQDDLKEEDLLLACQMLHKQGARGILATIISDSVPAMENRIRRLATLRSRDPLIRRMIWGIHVEGPFLNAENGYRGAHPLDAMLPADVAVADRLLTAGEGLVRLFTLAPEQDPEAEVIRFLVERKVIVSAGHTNADTNTLRRSIDAGLSMFTHLGNGCPMIMPRHDNIVQRVLALRELLYLCFIGDGIHIPFFALQNYFDLIGSSDKIIMTTDAISAAGLGPGRYTLGHWDLLVGADLAVRSPDGTHLVGSACPMPRLIQNLQQELNLDAQSLSKIVDTNARQALQFHHTFHPVPASV